MFSLLVSLIALLVLGVLMSTQADLVAAVADLEVAVAALEAKPDTQPAQLVDQAALDSAVSGLSGLKARVDAETSKK